MDCLCLASQLTGCPSVTLFSPNRIPWHLSPSPSSSSSSSSLLLSHSLLVNHMCKIRPCTRMLLERKNLAQKEAERMKSSREPCDEMQRNSTKGLGRRSWIALASTVMASEMLLHPLGLEAAEKYGPPDQADRARPSVVKLDNGLQFIDVKEGSGEAPVRGEKVAIHYYARLGSKQGWRFDSTYDHKDSSGTPQPFEFVVGSPSVIAGLSFAVESMKVGGIRRVIIPPTLGYQSKNDEPLPPNFFDRQRLFTTVFNPTRLNNGEGDTLGTVIFDIQLLGKR